MHAPSMSLNRRQTDALSHIVDQCQKAIGLAADLGTQERLEENWQAQYPMERCVEIVGEASKRLGPTFHQEHSSLPWKLITGMRDKLVHHYDRMNPAILWQTVTEDLPKVLTVVQGALRTDEPPE